MHRGAYPKPSGGSGGEWRSVILTLLRWRIHKLDSFLMDAHISLTHSRAPKVILVADPTAPKAHLSSGFGYPSITPIIDITGLCLQLLHPADARLRAGLIA